MFYELRIYVLQLCNYSTGKKNGSQIKPTLRGLNLKLKNISAYAENREKNVLFAEDHPACIKTSQLVSIKNFIIIPRVVTVIPVRGDVMSHFRLNYVLVTTTRLKI